MRAYPNPDMRKTALLWGGKGGVEEFWPNGHMIYMMLCRGKKYLVTETADRQTTAIRPLKEVIFTW